MSPSQRERNLRRQLLNDLENKMRESVSSVESEERYIRGLEKEIESIKKENMRLVEDLEEIRTNIVKNQEKMQELNTNMKSTTIECSAAREEKEFLIGKNEEIHKDLFTQKELISQLEKKVNPYYI